MRGSPLKIASGTRPTVDLSSSMLRRGCLGTSMRILAVSTRSTASKIRLPQYCRRSRNCRAAASLGAAPSLTACGTTLHCGSPAPTVSCWPTSSPFPSCPIEDASNCSMCLPAHPRRYPDRTESALRRDGAGADCSTASDFRLADKFGTREMIHNTEGNHECYNR
jgi:hypothetical protein